MKKVDGLFVAFLVTVTIIVVLGGIALIGAAKKAISEDFPKYSKAVMLIGGERTEHEIKRFESTGDCYDLTLANGDRIRIAKGNCELLEVHE